MLISGGSKMKEDTAFEKKYNELTSQVLGEMFSEDSNTVMSPLSIYLLLAAASHATSGSTREEILKAISSEEGPQKTLDALFTCTRDMMKDGALLASNGIYVREDIRNSVREEYLSEFKRLFAGKLFSSPDAKVEINNWVKEKSNGMIENFADDSMLSSLVTLFNITAFEGKWLEPYERSDVEEETFYNLDKTRSSADMMCSTESLFFEDIKMKGIVKPYRDIDYSFMAILPKRKGKRALESCIKHTNLTKAFRSAEDSWMFCKLPKLKYDSEINLRDYCSKLGIDEVFSDHADFSNMSSEWLKADKIIHKAKIQLDEEGTKAAASTSMEIAFGGCIRESIEFNRPFIYAIMNNSTGLPVFAGVVTNFQ